VTPPNSRTAKTIFAAAAGFVLVKLTDLLLPLTTNRIGTYFQRKLGVSASMLVYAIPLVVMGLPAVCHL
jgi:hypothetical protein